jgi:hypothetical protein
MHGLDPGIYLKNGRAKSPAIFAIPNRSTFSANAAANSLLSESTFVDWSGLQQKLAAPQTTFAEWDVIDKKLASLVDTWAAP